MLGNRRTMAGDWTEDGGMSPIGESTFSQPDTPDEGLEVPREFGRSVQRVGSLLECEEEGEFRSWLCPRDQTIVRIPVTCKAERLCPQCSRRWAFKEAKRAAWRLAHVQKRKVYGRVAPRHVVISFAEGQGEELTVAGYDDLFGRAWAVLRRMGIRGGVAMVHPWRRTVEDYSDLQGRLIYSRWFPGPHVHFLAWGLLDLKRQPGNAFVRVIDDKQERSETATLAYLLDHCGVVERKHALRWLGVASYNKCPGVPKYPKEVSCPLCPVCGGRMRELGVSEDVYMGWMDLARGLDHYRDTVGSPDSGPDGSLEVS